MELRMIEVHPDYKDLAEDSLKAASIGAATWLMSQYVFGNPMPLNRSVQLTLAMVAGYALFYLVVDKMLVRFVVKSGTEGYYAAKRRRRH